MLSLKTCIQLITIIENDMTQAEVDRIFYVFDLKYLIIPAEPNQSKAKKANHLLGKLSIPTLRGPFSESFQLDLLEYVVIQFYQNAEKKQSHYLDESSEEYQSLFSNKYHMLGNSLQRDGYSIQGLQIKKLLPVEIEEAKIESELFQVLKINKFEISKGHLDQAIDNHSRGNWAGANSQFRSFIESILMETANMLLPQNKCSSAASAINLLSNSVSPPFLSTLLNEVQIGNSGYPFVDGLWKRLHPEGSHPGLSDEEDSTFRYHMSVIFANYILKRLKQILNKQL